MRINQETFWSAVNRSRAQPKAARAICTDDIDNITAQLNGFIADPDIDCGLNRGYRCNGRDVTPEAFRAVFEKEIEGFGEMFRFLFSKWHLHITEPCGRRVAGGTYLFALPGSPSACRDAWDDLLAHQLDYRHRPCNFVEIMPRSWARRGRPVVW